MGPLVRRASPLQHAPWSEPTCRFVPSSERPPRPRSVPVGQRGGEARAATCGLSPGPRRFSAPPLPLAGGSAPSGRAVQAPQSRPGEACTAPQPSADAGACLRPCEPQMQPDFRCGNAPALGSACDTFLRSRVSSSSPQCRP